MTILTFESHANYCILYATVNKQRRGFCNELVAIQLRVAELSKKDPCI